MINFTKPIAFLDTETTGADPANDRIVSIAVRKYTAADQFEDRAILINPGIPIPAEATEVHGITDDMVKDCPKFQQVAKGILAFIQGCDLAGYNIINFDIIILAEEFARAGFSFPDPQARFFDGCAIFKKKEERNLKAAVKFYCGRELEGAHDAYNDTKASADVFFAQLERYEDLSTMSNDEIAEFCKWDTRIDLAGKFIKDPASGAIIINHGKNKGGNVRDHQGFLEWMMKNKNFYTQETMKVAGKLLEWVKSKRK